MTSEALTPLPAPPSVLLAATFGAEGAPRFRGELWLTLLGDAPNAWSRLATEDADACRAALNEAADGYLVTHVLIAVPAAGRDEPFPVLLNFIPVHDGYVPPGRTMRASAVAVMGEVLAEPTSFTTVGTRRHRIEALGRMTMGIAHDLNNLLASVLGHIELLRAQQAVVGTEGMAHLATMERAALDGAALIGKIQRFLRKDKETRYVPVSLSEIAEEATALTRPYWQNEPRRQGIEIALSMELSDVPPILGSPTELREVLVNLILNAVQAMPSGGILQLVTYSSGGEVGLMLTDTGTGMPPEVQARIFEPMFSTKGELGNGMGLAVAEGIVRAHEGRVEVDSMVGRGTSFRLVFPEYRAALPAAAPAVAETPRARARLLVVDDEPLVRTTLLRLLRLRGHEVVEATGGEDALARGDLDSFDAVLTDLGMPGMNGRSLATALRRQYPDLPIVLLTGDTEPGDPDEVITAVLAKPFRTDDLDALIQRLLRTRPGGAGGEP
ncbi:MAG TPA: ATP-binding protein [Rhodothermales bacterium]|nr:ATP-binding protein [Rhodothermales bacterium]